LIIFRIGRQKLKSFIEHLLCLFKRRIENFHSPQIVQKGNNLRFFILKKRSFILKPIKALLFQLLFILFALEEILEIEMHFKYLVNVENGNSVLENIFFAEFTKRVNQSRNKVF